MVIYVRVHVHSKGPTDCGYLASLVLGLSRRRAGSNLTYITTHSNGH